MKYFIHFRANNMRDSLYEEFSLLANKIQKENDNRLAGIFLNVDRNGNYYQSYYVESSKLLI